MSASASMDFVTKKVSRMSTRLKSRRSTLTGSISSISKSCMLKRPTFKPWMPEPETLLDSVRTSMFQETDFQTKETGSTGSQYPGCIWWNVSIPYHGFCFSEFWFHRHHIILYNFPFEILSKDHFLCRCIVLSAEFPVSYFSCDFMGTISFCTIFTVENCDRNISRHKLYLSRCILEHLQMMVNEGDLIFLEPHL